MRKLLAATFIAVLTTGLPGDAFADANDPQISDACGDADRMVQVGDVIVGTQDPQRAAGYDVKSVKFEDLYDDQDNHVGVRIHLQMCGALPAPQITYGYWSVGFDIEGPCSRSVSIQDSDEDSDPTPAAQRRAFLSSSCTRPSELLPGWTEGYVEWTAPLESSEFSVAGDTITWTLTPDTLPAGRTDFVNPGTQWASPGATARDGRRLTETSFDDPIPFLVSGPGAYDHAGSDGSFTVGAQSPDAA